MLSLHRCKVCGTAWLLWPDAIHGGGWNLLDKYQRPGACCDNAAMGDQIEHLRDIPLAAAPVPCAASPADQWQPIATAPKDGRTIFVGTVAWLAASNHVEHGRWFTWHPPLFGHRSHGDGGAAESPTHWMPLPTPPRATGEGADEQAQTIQSEAPPSAATGVDDAPAADFRQESPVDAPVAVSLDPHRLLPVDDVLGLIDQYISGAERRGFQVDAIRELREKVVELARLRGEATVRVEE